MKAISSLLLIIIVSALLISASTSVSTRSGDYEPWVDFDDDGDIDIFDIVRIAGIYGTTGEPYEAKAALEYDSNWINITDKHGQYFNIIHNLHIIDWDSANIVVDITGKTAMEGDNLNLGLTNYTRYQTYGGETDSEAAESLVQTSDGGYALAGITMSLDSASSDFWLVKTDASGNMQWSKTYGGTGNEQANALVQTIDGGYALAGTTLPHVMAYSDFWLVKTDASGNMQWNKTYGGTSGDYAKSLVQTSDGGYVIACTTTSFGAGSSDFWLIKTDELGNMQWNKTYGGTSGDYAWSLVQTSDGGYALTGYTRSFGTSYDYWLVKTDSSGNHVWNKTYGGTLDDFAKSLVQTSDGGYALIGYTRSFGAGGPDYWLIKTDELGNMQWNKTYGGTLDDYAKSLVQTSDGGYALTGNTLSFGAGYSDFWLVKTDASGNMQWNKTYGGIRSEQAKALVQTIDGGYALTGYTDSFGAGGADFWLVRVNLLVNGLSWTDCMADVITLHRAATDIYWNYVRVRIWKIKGTP